MLFERGQCFHVLATSTLLFVQSNDETLAFMFTLRNCVTLWVWGSHVKDLKLRSGYVYCSFKEEFVEWYAWCIISWVFSSGSFGEVQLRTSFVSIKKNYLPGFFWFCYAYISANGIFEHFYCH